MILNPFIAVTFLSTVALGQVVATVPVDVKEHDPIVVESVFEVPDGAAAIHEWSVDGGAKGVEFPSGAYAIWAAPKAEPYKVRHSLLVIDWDARTFEKKVEGWSFRVSPDGKPPKPPKPDDPDTPDPETELGAQVKAWRMEILDDEASRAIPSVADNYRKAADGLDDGTFGTINQASQFLRDENNYGSQASRDKWRVLMGRVGDVWNSSWPMNRSEVATFFRSVAEGLEG